MPLASNYYIRKLKFNDFNFCSVFFRQNAFRAVKKFRMAVKMPGEMKTFTWKKKLGRLIVYPYRCVAQNSLMEKSSIERVRERVKAILSLRSDRIHKND